MELEKCVFGGKCCMRNDDGYCIALTEIEFSDNECHFRKSHRNGVNEYDLKKSDTEVKCLPLKARTIRLPNGKEYAFVSHPCGCLFCKHLREPYITNGREFRMKCKVGNLEDGFIGRCAWFERSKK